MSKPLLIDIEILKHAQNLAIPSYQTDGAAGMDLFAALETSIELKPSERVLVPTGLKISLPLDVEAQIRPRSGLALKQGVTVLNSPGTIDSDYRGEIKILMINHGLSTFFIEHGSRIAQLVISPIIHAKLREVSILDITKRGQGGFGSTDKKA